MRSLWQTLRVAAQSKREVAHRGALGQFMFSKGQNCGRLAKGHLRSSIRCPETSRTRYAFPRWPAFSPSRPATESCRQSVKTSTAIGYHGDLGDEYPRGRVTGDAHETTTIGSRLCRRHQSSLQQWQYLVWQVALITTWSAAWWVQARALWPLNCLAQTAQVQSSRVQPWASFVMTQASTPVSKLDNRALCGRINSGSRQRDMSPMAAFSF